MNHHPLFTLSWHRYLNLLFLLLSVGFLTGGSVTFIATNWDYFSDLSKIYGLQAVFAFSVISGSYFFMRESRRLEQEKLKSLSVSFFFIAAVLIGATLALVGQTYQTGADTWQLFAVWSLCQLPWLLLLPNAASALLLIVTTNLTLYLLSVDGFYEHATIYGVVLNAIGLLLSEIFIRQLHDQRWRVLPKILVVFLLLHLFGCRFVGEYYDLIFPFELYPFHSFLLIALPAAALFYFYQRYRFDFVNLITTTTAIIVAFGLLLFNRIDSLDIALLNGLLIFALTVGAIIRLYQLYKAHYPERKNLPWGLSFLLILAILTGILTALVWVVLALNLSEPENALPGLSVVVLGTALMLHRANPQSGSPMSIVVGILFLMGYGLLGGYLLLDRFAYDSVERFNFSAPAWFTLVVAIFYFVRKEIWLQTLSLVAVLMMWQLSAIDMILQTPLVFLSMLGAVFAFLAQRLPSINDNVRAQIIPLAWAFLLFSLGALVFDLWGFSAYHFASTWSDNFNGVADELPPVNTFADFFNVITHGVFAKAKLSAAWLISFLVCLAPLGVYGLMNRFFSLSPAEKWTIAGVLALFTVSFIAQPTILFFASLWLLAYFVANRYLFFIALAALIINLAIYYYWLSIPLLYKAFLLLFFGVIFALSAIYLHRKHQEETKSAVNFAGVSKIKPTIALCTLFFILFPLNYKVWQFEDVLATGKPVVLEIAPVDPRSLMQGDYMSLSYAILTDLTDIRAQLNESNTEVETSDDDDVMQKQRPKRLYALIHQNEQGIATLCRVESRIPTDFFDCVPNVYLPINNAGRMPKLPSQEYFFAEGKGQYYAQAEYAEYRFKDGILLLARLLDKDLKPL